MIRRRVVLFALAAPLLGWIVLRAFAAAPAFGRPINPGAALTARAVRERQATNAVAAVVFDYRGYDTLGEECILFAAVLGIGLIMREGRTVSGRAHDGRRRRRSEAVLLAGVPAAAVTALVGAVLVVHGHLTPGGGFQGGAVAASALILAYLLGGREAVEHLVSMEALEVVEVVGVGGFAGFALSGLALGRPLLTNVLPFGAAGHLLSSGSILLLNVAVGLAVAAGFGRIALEFLRESPGTD